MGKKYMLCLFLCLIMIFPCACTVQGNLVSEETENTKEENAVLTWADMEPVSSMELAYATGFCVDYYEYGYALLTIVDDGRYLIVPEKLAVPAGLEQDITVICKPLENIYLVATSVMDLICAIDGLDSIRLSGTDIDGWYIEAAKEAMAQGDILYAGKYSTPDYELILSENCDLAIESTMIYHNPEVKEQLEQLQIPVLVERSSYESHPLGRLEWLKVYGLLLGKEQAAQTYFEEQLLALSDVLDQKNTGKTVAFFYVTSNGAVNVRKSTDYVAKLISLAGGIYVPSDISDEENALSTMNMQMEAFYAAAKDADYLIYNSTVDGELETLAELFEKNELFRDFKAVSEGHVWCIGKNMFQESTGLGNMILDIHRILTDENASEDDLYYLHRLQ